MVDRLRRLDLLSPIVAFPLAWCLGLAAAQVHVLEIQSQWSTTVWMVMLAIPVAFVCGGLLGGTLVDRVRGTSRSSRSTPSQPRRTVWPLLTLLAIGTGELAHQFAAAGSIPLLSANIDGARTGLPGGPTIVLVDALTIAAVVALSRPPRLFSRDGLPDLAIAGWALGMYALAGGRGTVILPVLVAVFCRWRYWGRPSWRLIVIGAGLGCAFASLLFFYRTAQTPGQPFQQEFFRSTVPDTPLPLVPLLPLHLGLAMNFEALAQVVGYFPSQAPYGHGVYDAQGLDIVFRGAKPLGDISAQLTPPWLTSTVAGPFWADGGIVLTVLAMTCIGFVVGCVDYAARATGSFRMALLAAYALYLSLFGLYQNLWTQQMDWLVNGAGLLVIGTLLGPESARRKWRWATYRQNLRKLMPSRHTLAWAAGLGALLLAMVVIVLVSRSGTDAADKAGPKTNDRSSAAFAASASFRLPAGSVDERSTIMTDGDAADDNEPVWIGRRQGREVSLQEVVRTSKRTVRRSRLARRIAAPAGSTLDVSTWSVGEPTAVFTAREIRQGVTVAGFSVASGTSRAAFVRGTALLAPPPPGVTRDLRIARWSGDRPDLFVVDRGSDLSRVRIRIYAGETSFSQSIADIKAPIRGLAPPNWSMDVGRTGGRRPDIVFTVGKGGSGHPEIQVLDGDSGFQKFKIQRQTALSPEELRRFAVGTSVGFPTLDLLAPGRGARLIFAPIDPTMQSPPKTR